MSDNDLLSQLYVSVLDSRREITEYRRKEIEAARNLVNSIKLDALLPELDPEKFEKDSKWEGYERLQHNPGRFFKYRDTPKGLNINLSGILDEQSVLEVRIVLPYFQGKINHEYRGDKVNNLLSKVYSLIEE